MLSIPYRLTSRWMGVRTLNAKTARVNANKVTKTETNGPIFAM